MRGIPPRYLQNLPSLDNLTIFISPRRVPIDFLPCLLAVEWRVSTFIFSINSEAVGQAIFHFPTADIFLRFLPARRWIDQCFVYDLARDFGRIMWPVTHLIGEFRLLGGLGAISVAERTPSLFPLCFVFSPSFERSKPFSGGGEWVAEGGSERASERWSVRLFVNFHLHLPLLRWDQILLALEWQFSQSG